jgi:hypothetical protein
VSDQFQNEAETRGVLKPSIRRFGFIDTRITRRSLTAALDRPLSNWSCATGWITASIVFILLTRLVGGVTTSDAFVSVNSALAIAHGHLSCAYPPQTSLGGSPLAPPLYPLISGGLSAIFRVGHSLPFPNGALLGAHCSNAFVIIGKWVAPTGVLFTVVLLGYVGWFVLVAGIVTLLRASGSGRSVREVVTLLVIACAPPVIMCLNEYFHPQDLMAMGLALAGLGCVIRQRWLVAGVLFALAFTSQQFALLVVVPLAVTLSTQAIKRLLIGVLATLACIDGPVLIVTSDRAFKAILVGTGASTKRATLLVLTHLSGNAIYVVSRVLPIVLAVALALWIRRMIVPFTLDPVTLTSLVAVALTFRLVFEVNLWGYYFMALAVVMIVLQAMQRRLSWMFVLWLVVVTYAAVDGGLANRPALAPWPMSLWQAILVPWALVLSFEPLRPLLLRRHASVARAESP